MQCLHRRCSCVTFANCVVRKIGVCAQHVEISPHVTRRLCTEETNRIYAQAFGGHVQTSEVGTLEWIRRLGREWSIMLEC